MKSGFRVDPSEYYAASKWMSPPFFRSRNAASEARVTSMGSRAVVSIPDAGRLVDAVLERSTGKDSSIHGESHWQRVAATGLALLPETPDLGRRERDTGGALRSGRVRAESGARRDHLRRTKTERSRSTNQSRTRS